MYVVEYSESQKAYHIGEEMELLQKDIRAFEQRGWIGDYKTLARFETREEARQYLRTLKNA